MKHLNKYILGDAFEEVLFNYDIPDFSLADLVFTGVPDLEELGYKDPKQYEKFLDEVTAGISRIVKDDGFVVMCQTDRKCKGEILLKHTIILDGFIPFGFKVKDYKILVKDKIDKTNLFRLNYSHVLIMTRKGRVPTAKRKGEYLKDVWVSKLPKNKNFFGEDFVELIIKTLTDEGDLVIDPFAGRGTVLKVAKRLGRNFFGTEIKPEVYDLQYFNAKS